MSERNLEARAPAELFVDLNGLTPAVGTSSRVNVAEVPVRISAVLGKRRVSIAELMALSPGAVIELDRRVGEPIDLYVNERLVARGELVLVDGVLGVTMTEIIKSGER
jgi:flagellar motor switch protein FliN/FliY